MSWQEVAPQVLLAIVAALPGIYAIWRGRHKEKADVAKVITEAAGNLVEEYKSELESLKLLLAQQQEEIKCLEFQVERQTEKIALQSVRIDTLEAEREEVLAGVRALTAQIRKLGHDPVWEPEGK